jgi:hypothetical protein
VRHHLATNLGGHPACFVSIVVNARAGLAVSENVG